MHQHNRPDNDDGVVDLDGAAAMIAMSVKRLARYVREGRPPQPDFQAGQTRRWRKSTVRAVLRGEWQPVTEAATRDS